MKWLLIFAVVDLLVAGFGLIVLHRIGAWRFRGIRQRRYYPMPDAEIGGSDCGKPRAD